MKLTGPYYHRWDPEKMSDRYTTAEAEYRYHRQFKDIYYKRNNGYVGKCEVTSHRNGGQSHKIGERSLSLRNFLGEVERERWLRASIESEAHVASSDTPRRPGTSLTPIEQNDVLLKAVKSSADDGVTPWIKCEEIGRDVNLSREQVNARFNELLAVGRLRGGSKRGKGFRFFV